MESTEEDLEQNHYLEEIGDTLWETVLEISCCPFCGETLKKKGDDCQGKFTHRNFLDWTVK